jgi:argininosuccinate lyase
MLVDRRIVTPADGHRLRVALDAVSLDAVQCAPYDGSCEDLFFYIDTLLVNSCGADVAGRLHTARSRNDIDMTMYRMRQREWIAGLSDATCSLRQSLVNLTACHHETVFAARTHTQPAQPTTVAHYLLAVIEQLERDAQRLRAAYGSTNRCPLGACAITGTGFPIDRSLTSDLLGFDAPTGNTYGSIAAVDYLLESTSAAAVLVAGLGRVLQDLLTWCSAELAYLRLADGFVQTSSIMPQKRNPVALEHARGLASKALGQASAIVLAVHNTPFGDIVDVEDDLQPLVAAMFRDAHRAVALTAAALRDAEFDAARLASRAAEGGTTLTELADRLVRDHGIPFGAAHAITTRMLKQERESPQARRSTLLAHASLDLLGRALRYDDGELERMLSAEHFVAVRKTLGGPAPAITAHALQQSRRQLDNDRQWVADVRGRVARAATELRDRGRAL